MDVDGKSSEHPVAAAFDEDVDTYWTSGKSELPIIFGIDLGKKQKITGFAYTPQRENGQGMMAAGTVEVSNDGKRWKKVEDFVFGNLVNDPTKRYCYFKKAVKGRYFRLVTTEIAGNGRMASMAELDVF